MTEAVAAGAAVAHRHREDTLDGSPRHAPVVAGTTIANRLRDLPTRDRWLAAALATVLALPPIVAFVHVLPLWRPAGDVAFMALRTFDVGTGRTPILGQPSSSGHYTGTGNVHHLGAGHFYLMAPFVRAFGATVGMLLVSVLVTVTASLAVVWAVFRSLGRGPAVATAALVSAVLFGVGASGMLYPISSSFTGVPLFCSAVLAWAVMAGDDRLLPVAAGVLTFTVHVHLSAGPPVAILGMAVILVVAARWWRAGLRHDRTVRRHAARWTLAAAGTSLVLWLPLLAQEAFGDRGNLSALVSYALDGGETGQLGPELAVRQVAHAVAVPPPFARPGLTGHDLLEVPSTAAWVAAAAVLAVLAWAGMRWHRAGDPRRSLPLMAGLLVAVGLVSGSSVPEGPEMGRLVLYHWIWPLAFFTWLTVALLVADLAGGAWSRVREAAPLRGRPARRLLPAGTGVLLLIAGLVPLAVVGPTMDRYPNDMSTMGALYPRGVYEDLVDQVAQHRDRLPSGEIVLVARGNRLFDGTEMALAVALEEAGIRVQLQDLHRTYVHADRIASPGDGVEAALILALTYPAGSEAASDGSEPDDAGAAADLPGERLASHDLITDDLDREAYDTLLRQFEEVDEIRPGPELREAMAEDEAVAAMATQGLSGLPERARQDLLNPVAIDILLEYPLARPELDTDLLRRLRDSLEDRQSQGYIGEARSMQVHLVTGDEELQELVPDLAG